MWTTTELDLRARRYVQLRDVWLADPAKRDLEALLQRRDEALNHVRGPLSEFLSGSASLQSLREFVDPWSRQHGVGFKGPAGMMVLNQFSNDGEAGEVDNVVRASLTLPRDLDDALTKLDALALYVEKLRAGGSSLGVGRVPYFVSWFWMVQDARWRPIWPSAEAVYSDFAWLPSRSSPVVIRYRNFVELLTGLAERCGAVSGVPAEFEIEEVAAWFHSGEPSVGMDETLSERCARAQALRREPGTNPSEESEYDEALTNVRVMQAEINRLGHALRDSVGDELGMEVKASAPSEFWVSSKSRLRADAWVSWRPQQVDGPAPSIRLWVTADGAFVVLDPEVNINPRGFGSQAAKALRDFHAPGIDLYRWNTQGSRSWLTPVGWPDVTNIFELGAKLDDGRTGAFDSLAADVREVVAKLKPAVDRVVSGAEFTAPEPEGGEPPSDLASLASEFRAQVGYPGENDFRHQHAREEFANALDSARLPLLTRDDLRRIAAGRYGSPGPQSILNTTLAEADDEQWDRLLATIDYLCWDVEDPVDRRIDRVLDEADLGARGFKEAVVMKLLAISHPEQFIPVYPFTGDNGKARMLTHLGLEVPPLRATAGERHVRANDALRSQLEPLFPEDPWGQMRFLYWLLQREDGEEPEPVPVVDPLDERLAEAASDLYVDVEFLSSIVDLLEDRGQVVFYGPPGTGKTFIAQRLAEAITGAEERWTLVQFHPSTSYEDFFEGFRPEALPDGGLTYRLVPGPLRMIAADAEADRLHKYVLVIDELNRANVPKVLGELLFLLEYRKDRGVRPLYRPEEEFKLPENLFIIATMNTADRSVARLDAALRRRFHFVPFIPDVAGRSAISGVLGRWVEANGELETLPEIVDTVNNQLRAALGGDHLLLGPSYFMKKGIDEAALRRIWEFQVEPLIEDLFFGEPERIEQFRFDRIWSKFGAPAVAEADATNEPAK